MKPDKGGTGRPEKKNFLKNIKIFLKRTLISKKVRRRLCWHF